MPALPGRSRVQVSVAVIRCDKIVAPSNACDNFVGAQTLTRVRARIYDAPLPAGSSGAPFEHTTGFTNGKRLQPSPRPAAVRHTGTDRLAGDGDAARNRADARGRAAPSARDGRGAGDARAGARLHASVRASARTGVGGASRRGVLRA